MNDAWDTLDEQAEKKQSQMRQCGNLSFGCGQAIAPIDFNFKVHLCRNCSTRAREAWGILLEDLDYLMVAIQTAKAGKMGIQPSRDEVMIYFRKLQQARTFPAMSFLDLVNRITAPALPISLHD